MSQEVLMFFFQKYGDHRDLHSFPTRRSSDLASAPAHLGNVRVADRAVHEPPELQMHDTRSEEHTSELQSHSDLVCRLLLEKKKRAVCIERKQEGNAARLGGDIRGGSRRLPLT